jgi:hypothetical protein
MRDGTFGRASLGTLTLACHDVMFLMLCGKKILVDSSRLGVLTLELLSIGGI